MNPQKEHLRPLNTRTPEEVKEITSKAGKASAKVRKEKRMFKQLLEDALSYRVTNVETGEVKSRKEMSMAMLAHKCMKGDLKAIKLAESILGETQASKVEVTGKNGQDLIPARRLSEEEAKVLMTNLENDY